tara:strand:- start:23218 stop:23937 length:720 start_codon:yes stop_codon:yes gene_type:complete
MGKFMKVVILAGGFGTRLSEYTDLIPKPMVPIADIPILVHIMRIYSFYGHTEFYILLGYKSDVIKDYFKKNSFKDWKIHLIDTGLETMTGGRLKRAKEYLQDETFFLTYGDGVGDIDINASLKLHNKYNKTMTVTAVHPPARFGELELKDEIVLSFEEKPQMQKGWINGGFFVVEPSFIDLIENDTIMLEREPMKHLTQNNQIIAYKHDGFWQCMDNKREHKILNKLWKNGEAKWLLNK